MHWLVKCWCQCYKCMTTITKRALTWNPQGKWGYRTTHKHLETERRAGNQGEGTDVEAAGEDGSRQPRVESIHQRPMLRGDVGDAMAIFNYRNTLPPSNVFAPTSSALDYNECRFPCCLPAYKERLYTFLFSTVALYSIFPEFNYVTVQTYRLYYISF